MMRVYLQGCFFFLGLTNWVSALKIDNQSGLNLVLENNNGTATEIPNHAITEVNDIVMSQFKLTGIGGGGSVYRISLADENNGEHEVFYEEHERKCVYFLLDRYSDKICDNFSNYHEMIVKKANASENYYDGYIVTFKKKPSDKIRRKATNSNRKCILF